MTDDTDQERDLRLDVLAAELRLETADARLQLARLAARLTALLPGNASAVTVGQGAGGQIGAVGVTLGTQHFSVRQDGARLVYEQCLRVHGIDLRHLQLRPEAWSEGLLAALEQELSGAREDAQGTDALGRRV